MQGGTVTLEGQGMPAARLAQLFELLHMTKLKGIGLGLYIVQEIATAHEGQITVESVEGQGTTFTITLHPKWEGRVKSLKMRDRYLSP